MSTGGMEQIYAITCDAAYFDDGDLGSGDIAEPVQVGQYSIDDEGEMHLDNRSMCSLKPDISVDKTTKVCIDLKSGHEQFIDLSDTPLLKNLLYWAYRTGSGSGEKSLNKVCADAEFVCYRGLLTELLRTPYQPAAGGPQAIRCRWQFVARKATQADDSARPIILLCAFDTDWRKSERAASKGAPQTFWGYRFRQSIASKARRDGDDDDENVARTDQTYHRVLSSDIGGHRILLAAEVGCAAPGGHFIRPKTIGMDTRNKRVVYYPKLKRLQNWAQCAVTKETILCGQRDASNTTITTVRPYSLAALEEDAFYAAGPRPIARRVCVNFLSKMLSILKELLVGTDVHGVFVQKKAENHHVEFFELSDSHLNGDYQCLTPEFAEYFCID